MFPFDPLGDLAQKLQEAYLYLVQIFQDVIAAPKTLDKTPFVQYLYGNALGLRELLAMSVTFVVFLIAIFVKKARVSLVISVVVFVVVATAGPLWFGVIAQAESMGDGLSKTVTDLFRTQGVTNTGLPVIGSFKDVLVSIYIFGATSWWGLILVTIFYGYVVLGVFIKFFGFLTLCLLALGERTQKVFNFLIAMGIVVFVLGKLSANAIIGASQALNKSLATVYADDLFTTGAVTIVSMIAAILIQPLLMFLTYKPTAPDTGKLFAKSQGKVDAKTEDRSHVTAEAVTKEHANSLQARTPAGPPVPPEVRQPKQGLQDTLQQAAMSKGAAMLAARAAASTNPVTGAAVMVGTQALKQLESNRGKEVRHAGD